jgi:hypothetical protein
MVETFDDGVMVLDADNVVVFANEALADMLGHSISALMGKALSCLVVDSASADIVWPQGVGSQIDLTEREIMFCCADGSCCWALMRTMPLFDGGGRYCGVRARIIDITALKTAEGEVKRLNEELEGRNAALEAQVRERTMHLEEFVATVSHEFRTPLTSVRGYVDLMKNDADLPREDQERYLDRLLANSLHMGNLLNSLLDLSRAAHGNVDLDRRPLGLRGALEQWEGAMAPEFAEKGVEFVMHLDEAAWPNARIVTDRDSLTRIMSNLLSNGCKYTPTGGQVTLRAEKKGARVVLTVADTGVGIPADEQKRIFTKFYRGSNTRRLPIRGTGLGLAITKSLVELLGGDISFASQEGEGSTFRVSLPVD